MEIEGSSPEQDIQPVPVGVKKKSKRVVWIVTLGLLTLGGLYYGPAIADLFPVLAAYFEKPDMRQYEASRSANLQAIHRALGLAHENDGEFPDSATWMDSLKSVIRTNDMSEEEALKKFKNPLLKSGFGYAFNDAASKQYRGELDPKTPLVFETEDGAWNAHGDPARHPEGARAVTVDGTIITLGSTND